ncbi:sugar transporter Stl1p [[Candida] jaroonii]|uniref:Sugar transporter Stl1p n=1 Tax=[Candida] jaroonii TaxID=467808 RepID=A0ACA9Y4T7_9ASCO|nr:sugar transporter Stl1p [[Candida] jaroonii]
MKYIQFWNPGKPARNAVTFTCELAFVLFGLEQGILGIVILGQDFLNQFGHPTGSYLGIIVSLYTLGCFFGCILNYFVGPKLGRRKTIGLAMILIIIGITLQASAFTVPHFMVGRFITGLGTGMETSSVPMYQAELSKASSRGNKVSSEALFVGIGLVIAYFMDFGLSYTNGPLAWRLPISLQIPFAIVVLVSLFFIPESPRYLFINGQKEKAKEVLCYIFDREPDHPDIIESYGEIEEAVALEEIEGKYSWKRLVKKDHARTRTRVLLAYGSMFAQQLGGINLINYYITTVLVESVGLEHTLAMILGGVSTVCFTIGSLVPAFLTDRLGRRMPLVYGFFGCGFCFLMISVLLSIQGSDALQARCGAAAVGFFFLYQLIFGASGNCIPWTICAEIIPLHARAYGVPIAISSNWLWNFFVVEITPVIITDLQWKAYLIFTCTNFAFVPMFYFFYPETKGLTLEAIDKLFSENRTAFMGLVDHKKIFVDQKSESISVEKPQVDYVETA